MKRVYIDASVCNVLLFGEEKEAERFSHVVQLFEVINSGEIKAVVSLYTLQEICIYCQGNFPQETAAEVSRLAVRDLLNNEVELVPLLTRIEALASGRKGTVPGYGTKQPEAGWVWISGRGFVTEDGV